MDQVSTLERVFSYKANANSEMLAAMRQFDDASPAKEIAIRVLNHTYSVDSIFAANLRRAEHGYASPNPGRRRRLRNYPRRSTQRSVVPRLRITSGMKPSWPSASDFTFTDGLPGPHVMRRNADARDSSR